MWYSRSARLRPLLVLAAVGFLSGCDALSSLPRDSDKWSDRIRTSGVLPVGVAHRLDNNSDDGPELARFAAREKRIAEAVARQMNARVEWRDGSALPLLEKLSQRELPLVLALVPQSTPYKGHIGLSRAYAPSGPGNTPLCIAVAPGENALLLVVDRVIEEERTEWEKEPAGGTH